MSDTASSEQQRDGSGSLFARSKSTKRNFALVIHGGAGAITREESTEEQRTAYKRALGVALKAGHAVLEEGGEAMDAAVAAVMQLENNPLFNSGRGAVFNVAGKNELDVSLMLSKHPSNRSDILSSRRGVGITGLTKIKNPSSLARSLYLSPSTFPHTLISGPGAETLNTDPSQVVEDPCYFFTKTRWTSHRRGLGLPAEPYPCDESEWDSDSALARDEPGNTVGAVALDERGAIAAVTSTGGLTNKLVGRIGDTPVMGSGFWAEEWVPEETVYGKLLQWIIPRGTRAMGISGTGDGDYYIRLNTASTIIHRMKFLGESLKSATNFALKELTGAKATGGVIGLDGEGNAMLMMNTPGMYRGVIRPDGVAKVGIFADEELTVAPSANA
ncbi:asparaginase [Pterulicium gracile]|uniref:Asparaginase n=1 Tax=Pterulicium gracile TaxID=1884261 RepID=A0A5C3QUP9_9AGAR|nr:asparaginase [Pterula gracilis]